jgi:hypothetical protein
LRPYLSLAEGDTVTNIYKKTSLFGKRGIVSIQKENFCVAVTYDTGFTYVYNPIEVHRHLKQSKKPPVHYCIPIAKMPLFGRSGENVVLCDKDSTMFLDRSLEHTEDVNKVTCTHCIKVINTAEFKTLMEENTVSENTVATPNYSELMLCKVDYTGRYSLVLNTFDATAIDAMVEFMKTACQLNAIDIEEIFSGKITNGFKLVILKPVTIKTVCTYTVEEL